MPKADRLQRKVPVVLGVGPGTQVPFDALTTPSTARLPNNLAVLFFVLLLRVSSTVSINGVVRMRKA